MITEHIECTLAEYHAMKGVWSHSQIETLRESPPLFHGRHITGIYQRERTPELDAGTVAHACLLDPEGFDGVAAIIPPEALNEKGERRGQAWKWWSQDHEHLIQLKQSEAFPILQMMASVRDEPAAAALLEASREREFTITWTDPETGLRLRCRPDIIADVPIGTVVGDIKTTRYKTPEQFAYAIEDYGYHRQAAWYLDGLTAYGMNPVAFTFISVNKSPAHECVVYNLMPRAIQRGRLENRVLLQELKHRIESHNWKPRTWGSVYDIDLHERAYKQDQWSI